MDFQYLLWVCFAHGADVNFREKLNKIPLLWASQNGHIEVGNVDIAHIKAAEWHQRMYLHEDVARLWSDTLYVTIFKRPKHP